MNVACVLRSGGAYKPWHVQALRDGVAKHLPLPHRFICLADVDVPGVEVVPLKHDWPGWWAKVELWRPDLPRGRYLYLDLDTGICGDLSDIAGYAGRFAMINDLGIEEHGNRKLGASGVMAWRACDVLSRDIYETFTRMAQSAMDGRQIAGDQDWIRGSVSDRWDDLRRLYPGQIVSWKNHVRRNKGMPPDNARIICWHGTPKPWEVDWVSEDDYREAA